MLGLPPDHPQNWFRNAFIHFLDCPHGNWWFYVWHRGYLGTFEQTIRKLSGDREFAIPYWDWTELPSMPAEMFNGVLDPHQARYSSSTKNLSVFSGYFKTALQAFWISLSDAQRAQLILRGYADLDTLWNDVTGYSTEIKEGISGNMAYANPCGSRYLTRGNPHLDDKTSYNVSQAVIYSGLSAPFFYNASDQSLSFSSSRTLSHNTAPTSTTKFSILEGLPHNKVHNFVGGVGPLSPGPFGNMANNLSPIDPIFFLHHSNMDRLWDLWTRKQQMLGLPYLPEGEDYNVYASEPFLFFVNGEGQYLGPAKAGDFISTHPFDYDYQPGSGEAILQNISLQPRGDKPMSARTAVVQENIAALSVSSSDIKRHLSATTVPVILLEITLPHDVVMSSVRDFDVLIGSPDKLVGIRSDSPYYAGTVSVLGHSGHSGSEGAGVSFTLPLPKTLKAFEAIGSNDVTLKVSVIPSEGSNHLVPLEKASLRVIP
ncbi:MAG: tyrosinase family protein [Gammaproteobacteria bacterium]|nr:tyrosinase family protein [Gammaproteobacteria bacterium]NDE57462.1 tyrosinase family protein [Gammaproteobacteria bacterium]NDG88649.1 tyrosinase family protein [Gammaproteobacteria bacterium]